MPLPERPRRTRPAAVSRLRTASRTAAVLALSLVVGCDETIVTPTEVAAIRLSPESLTLAIGESAALTAEPVDAEGMPIQGHSVDWSSTDDGVASVDAAGRVTALGGGTAEIRASVEGASGQAEVRVLQPSRIQLARGFVGLAGAVGATDPAPVSVAVTNGGEAPLVDLSASVDYAGDTQGWLTAALSGSDAPAQVTLSVRLAGLPAGSYDAAVRIAAPEAANSPVTLSVALDVRPGLPGPPSDLAASAAPGAITLSWTDNSGNEVAFRIERRAPGEDQFREIATVDADVTTYVDTDLGLPGTYAYRLRACEANGCSGYSDPAQTVTVPAAPSSLAAATVSASGIQLSWSDNSQTETRFEVERRSGTGGFSAIAEPVANTATYVDDGLDPGTSYTYRVRACNGSGCSSYSDEATAATGDIPAPVAPSSLSASLTAGDEVELTWVDNSDIEEDFRIERRTGGSEYVRIDSVPAGTTSATDPDVEPDRRYTYRVQACGAGGCSTYSNEAPIATTPAAPTDLVATPVSPFTIELAWTDAASSETEYRIARATAGGAYEPVAVLAGGSTAYTDDGLAPATEYAYRVLACNDGGCATADAVATTPAEPIPAVPTDLVATVTGDTRIELAWTDRSDDETGFRVERRGPGAQQFSTVALPGADSTTYVDTDVSLDRVYVYRVRACANQCSDPSNEATATTRPVAPSSVSAAATSSTSIEVSWSDESVTETSVELERRAENGDFALLDQTLPANTTSYTDNGVEATTTYGYRLRACNDAGCSDYSPEATATTDATPAPSAPSGLDARIDSSGGVPQRRSRLEWTDNSATETKFVVERRSDGDADDYAVVADSLEANTRVWFDDSVRADSAYTYRVQACRDDPSEPGTDLCSVYSNEAGVTTWPAAPSGLTAEPIDSTQVNLEWTNNTAVVESDLRIERSTGGGAFARIDSLAPPPSSYSDPGLTEGTVYGYRLQACNDAGCSDYSNEDTATTPLIAPTGLGASALSTTSIALTWTDASAREGRFEVRRRTGTSGTFATVHTTGAGAESWTDSELSPGTTYQYEVLACNAVACSPPSNRVTEATESIPDAPTGLTVAGTTTGSVSLSWTDRSDNEDEFRVERNTGSGWTVIATPNPNATTYTDDSVDPGTAYQYRVRACNDGDCSDPSNTVTAATPLVAPSGLSASALSTSSIELTWTDNSGNETRFEVRRRTGTSGTFATVHTTGAGVESWTDTGLTVGTTYQYEVRACNAAACSAPSTRATAATEDVPDAPSGLTVTGTTTASVSLSWTDASDNEDEFRVERSTGGGWNVVATLGANATSHTDDAVSPGVQYSYRVSACNDGECSVPSSTATATTPLVAPSGLSATALSTSSIALAWTDNSSNETRFEVRRRTGTSGTFATVHTTGAGAESWTDTGLTVGTTYQYEILACNAVTCSAPSNRAAAATEDVPDAPSGLTVTGTTTGSVSLSWTDNSDNEDAFRVERSTGGGWSVVATPNANATTYTDDTVGPGAEYSYRVLACNDGECSDPSSTATATTPLVAPSGLSASALSTTSIALTWTDNSGNEDRFEVRRRTGTSGTFATVHTTGAGAESWTDTGLTVGTTYQYEILACNAVTCSAPSNQVTAITQAVPAAPSGLTVTGTTTGSVSLSWTDASDNEDELRVERSTGGGWNVVATLGANATSHTDDGLSPGVEYSYRIRACNDGNCSDPSNTATAATPLVAPSGLSASALSTASIELTWTDNSGNETRFEVRRRTGTSGTFATVHTTGAGAESWTDSGLSPGTTYQYEVLACNAVTCSDPSNRVTRATQAVPDAPSGLTVTGTTTGSVSLSWTDNSDNEDEFQVQRSTGGSWTVVATPTPNATTFTDNTVDPGTEYSYRVQACNVGNCSDPSNTATAATPLIAPSDLSGSALSTTSIELTWTDNSGNETGFEVRRRTGTSGTFTTVETTAAGAELWTDTGLNVGSTYQYEVLACNAVACSAPSNQATVATDDAPEEPTGFSATATSPTSVSLDWDDVAGETGYTIDRTENGGSFGTIASLPADSTRYDDQVSDGSTYDYRVYACSSGICGTAATASVKTPLAEPSSFTATPVSDTQITVTWSDNSRVEDRYELDWRYRNGWNTETLARNTESYVSAGLRPSTTYQYRLRACVGQNCTDRVNTEATTRPVATGTSLGQRPTEGLDQAADSAIDARPGVAGGAPSS